MSSRVNFVFKSASALLCRVILGALVRRQSPGCATNLQVHPQVGLSCSSWEEPWVHMVFQALFTVPPVSNNAKPSTRFCPSFLVMLCNNYILL